MTKDHCWRKHGWLARWRCRNGHDTDYLPCDFGCFHCRRCGEPLWKPDPDKEIERWTNIKNGIVPGYHFAPKEKLLTRIR